ncbi:hypothetical protein Ddc_05055 [Ditylenchus destructor]|nr:hypothetical protein Ddc_05055 [Ditylenchus destructor]
MNEKFHGKGKSEESALVDIWLGADKQKLGRLMKSAAERKQKLPEVGNPRPPDPVGSFGGPEGPTIHLLPNDTTPLGIPPLPNLASINIEDRSGVAGQTGSTTTQEVTCLGPTPTWYIQDRQRGVAAVHSRSNYEKVTPYPRRERGRSMHGMDLHKSMRSLQWVCSKESVETAARFSATAARLDGDGAQSGRQ